VLLVRDPATLRAAFAHTESYMPHDPAEAYPVDTTLEYSRPFRALKLWLAFRVHGADAIRRAVERNVEQAELLAREVGRYEDLDLLLEPELSVVLFRHAVAGVEVAGHNRRLAEALQADGRVYVASAEVDGGVWLRPCIVNYRTTDEDVLALVAITREVGARLAAAGS